VARARELDEVLDVGRRAQRGDAVQRLARNRRDVVADRDAQLRAAELHRGGRVPAQPRVRIGELARDAKDHRGVDAIEVAVDVLRVRQWLVRSAAAALHRGRGAGRPLIEQPLRGLTRDDGVRDPIRVLLVRCAAVGAALQRHAAARLHDVRGLVRGGVQIGRTAERDVAVGGERGGAELARRGRGRTVGVRADPGDVVLAEALRDLRAERQLATRALHAARGGGHRWIASGARDTLLHERVPEPPMERPHRRIALRRRQRQERAKRRGVEPPLRGDPRLAPTRHMRGRVRRGRRGGRLRRLLRTGRLALPHEPPCFASRSR
jgi:hypothetical protein